MAEPFAGIQPADRQMVKAWTEADQAKQTAVDAVKADPVLGRLVAERSPELADLIPDVVQVAVAALVPVLCDQYEADLAESRTALGHAHKAMQALLASSESEVDKLAKQRDRAVQDFQRISKVRTMHWRVAQRLREALAEVMGQAEDFRQLVEHLRGQIDAEVGATLTLLRGAASEAAERGDTARAQRLRDSALEHETEGCPVPLAECNAVREAFEVLAEYRARDAQAVTR